MLEMLNSEKDKCKIIRNQKGHNFQNLIQLSIKTTKQFLYICNFQKNYIFDIIISDNKNHNTYFQTDRN